MASQPNPASDRSDARVSGTADDVSGIDAVREAMRELADAIQASEEKSREIQNSWLSTTTTTS